jgi:hypothetical protein
MTFFWDAASCRLVELYRRSRGVNFYQTTLRNNPEDRQTSSLFLLRATDQGLSLVASFYHLFFLTSVLVIA